MAPDDLCEACSAVFADGSLDRYALSDCDIAPCEDDDGALLDNGATAIWHAHHLSAAAHRQAVSQGCILCSWIPTTHGEERGTFFCFAAADRPSYSDNVRVLLGRPKSSVSGDESKLAKTAACICGMPVENFGDDAELIHSGELSLSSGDTGSKEVMHMAKGWLQHCLKRHGLCAVGGGPDWLPRRLLAIDGSFARLVETTGRDLVTPYSTLSHCWGGMPSFVLTSQNMGELKKGLAFSQFDATFHDAMVTTQNLGIDYIWIDCYCIVQGQDEASLRDWKEQSVLMHKVYSNGTVNIAAAHGADSRAGLFVSRERWRDLCTIRWQPSLIKPELSWSIVQLNIRSIAFQAALRNPQELAHLPLFSRGWVLQERLLARRMLSFGARQIFWDCTCRNSASEVLPHGQINLDKDLEPGRLTNPDPETRPKVYEDIYGKAINIYSTCRLSFPHKDKLAAFEGIGKRICELMGTEYSVGFLKSTLPFSLCWNTIPHVESSWDQAAPSWHWASCKSVVEWRGKPECFGYHNLLLSYTTLITGHGPLVDRSLEYADLVCVGRLLWISEVFYFSGQNYSLLRVATSSLEQRRDLTTQVRVLDYSTDMGHDESKDLIQTRFDDEAQFEKKPASIQLYLLPIWNEQGYERTWRPVERSFWVTRHQNGLILSRSPDGSFRREGTYDNVFGISGQEMQTAMLNAKAQLVVIK